MARERLSRLQRRMLAWLVAEDRRLRGTMAARHEALRRALVARGFDKGNVSTSLKGLEAKGPARVRTFFTPVRNEADLIGTAGGVCPRICSTDLDGLRLLATFGDSGSRRHDCP
jgi:hypothetical protein